MTLDNNLLKKIENFKRHVLKSIPLPSTNTPSTDNTNGSTGSSLEYARSDHQHPKSTLYAESVHSHNDILSDLMDDINNTTIVVDSPNPIGQDGDTILLRGRMYGDDVSGKSIDYYIGNTLIGSSVTNGNGVSFLDYECDGLGVRNVTAKNGSIVSGTYPVLDCINYDPCTSDTTTNYGVVGGSKAFDINKIVVTRTTDGECYLELDTNNSLTLSEYLGKNIKLEIGGINAPSNVTIGIFQYVNGTWDRIISSGATSGTLSTNLSISASATRVRFRFITNNLNSNQSASFQSLKIYPI